MSRYSFLQFRSKSAVGFLFSLGLVSLFILLVAEPAHAGIGDEIVSALGEAFSGMFQTMIGWINTLLGYFLSFLSTCLNFVIDIFLGFAQYNGFGTALPVEIGWKLVRDLVNMFFVFLLLLSAFSTILGISGWEDFHYKKLLPRLLIMAILINFSRTLIQILIDFSQVIMLTFVNAFLANSSASISNAFGLTGMAKFAEDMAANKSTDQLNIMMAYLLSIAALIVALAVMIILTAFIIGRIIELWLILIFSPLALFLTAVPPRVSSKITALTEGYWNRLSQALVSGPLIAFFLWLALALMSAAGAGGAKLGETLALYKPTDGGPPGFLSEFGQSPVVAQFLIAIMLLLTALKEAVGGASAVAGGAFSGFAGKVSGGAKSLATKLSPIGAGQAVFRGATGGAKSVAATVDRRLDLTGRAARFGQKIPGVRSVFRQQLASGAVKAKVQTEAEARGLLQGFEGMSYAQKQARVASLGTSALASLGQRKAYADATSMLASDKVLGERQKSLAADLEAKMFDKVRKGKLKLTPEEIKQQALAEAGRKTAQEGAKARQAARTMYGALGDTSKVAELNQAALQNPLLAATEAKAGMPSEFDTVMRELRNDPDKVKALSGQAASSAKVLMGLLHPSAIKTNAQGELLGFDKAQVDAFMATHGNAQAGKNLQALIDYQKNSGGNVIRMSDLSSALVMANKGKMDLFDAEGQRMQSGREAEALERFNEQFAVDHGYGRTNGRLRSTAGSALLSMVQSGVPLGSVVERAATTKNAAGETVQDMKAVGDYLQQVFEVSLGAAERAFTSGGKVEVHLAPVLSVAQQLSGPGVSAETQLRALAGIHNKGQGADVIAGAWEGMSRDHRKAFQEVVKVAADRAADVAAKRAQGVTEAGLSEAERAVTEFVASLKKAMPAQALKEKDSQGNEKVVRARVPEALRPFLYG